VASVSGVGRIGSVVGSSVVVGGISGRDFEFFGLLEEGIVGLQVMWVNVDGIGRSVAGDNGLRGLAETAGEAALVGEGACQRAPKSVEI
jgi:hypothetical protein